MRALLDRHLVQVPVERERLVAVVDHHQPAISAEQVGEGHDAVVHGPYVRSRRARDLDAAQGRSSRRTRAEALAHGAWQRPLEVAPEGQQRQCWGRGGQSVQRVLELLLCRLEFTGELGVQLPLRVDLVDERAVRGDGLFGRGLRPLRTGLCLLHLLLSLGGSRARRLQRCQATLVLGNTVAVLLGESRHQPYRLSDLAQIGGGEQQPGILASPQFVECDQPRLQVGQRRCGLRGDVRDLLIDGSEFLPGGPNAGAGRVQFRRADGPLDFEPAQVAEEGALLTREAIGLVVQRLEAGRSPLGQGCGTRPIVLLLRTWTRTGQCQQGHAQSQGAPSHPHANIASTMRMLGVDLGRRRVGLAVSDPSGTLARPFTTLHLTAEDGLARVLAEVRRLLGEDDGLGGVVVGLPRSLDGTATAETAVVEQFVAALRAELQIPVVTEDERLSSREAESRLALRERDWKKRKAQLDAAAAAVILQDYLDRQGR